MIQLTSLANNFIKTQRVQSLSFLKTKFKYSETYKKTIEVSKEETNKIDPTGMRIPKKERHEIPAPQLTHKLRVQSNDGRIKNLLWF